MYFELSMFFHGLQAVTAFFLRVAKRPWSLGVAEKEASDFKTSERDKRFKPLFPGSLSTMLSFINWEDFSLQLGELISSSIAYSGFSQNYPKPKCPSRFIK